MTTSRSTTLDTNVTDEEVEKRAEQLREQHATYTAVEEDRPLQDGDFAVASFKGTPKESRKPTPSRSRWTRSWSRSAEQNTIPEFTENLRGAKAGEQKTFDVKYADDFSDKRLAGKTLTYKVNVKGIKTKQLPELNDDFAKELGADFNTLDDLRNRLRENMEAEKKHEAEHQGKDKLVEELVKRNDFPVPEALVNDQIDLRLERGLAGAGGTGHEDRRHEAHGLRAACAPVSAKRPCAK